MLSSLDPLFLSLSRNPSLAVRGCSGLSLAALAADLADRNGGTVVLVTPDDEEALSLYRAVQFLLGEPEDPPLFLGDRRAALLWPEETSPYDHRKVFSSRLRAMENLASLYSLSQPFRPRVLVTSALRFFRRGIPKAELNAGVDFVMAGAETDRDALLRRLTEGGYVAQPLVEDPGAFSARGGIVDCYCPLYRFPIRLQFLGDLVESIRLFDPGTQKSVTPLDEAILLPVREILLTPERGKAASSRIYDQATNEERLSRPLQDLLINLEEGFFSGELEPFLPHFFDHLETLTDHLPSSACFLFHNPDALLGRLEEWRHELARQHHERLEQGELSLPPDRYWVETEGALSLDPGRPQVRSLPPEGLLPDARFGPPSDPLFEFKWDDHGALRAEMGSLKGRAQVLDPLLHRLESWIQEGYRVVITAHTDVQARRLIELLTPRGIRVTYWDLPFPSVWEKVKNLDLPQAHLLLGPIAAGQVWEAERVVFISEEEIFGQRKRRVREAALDPQAFLSSLDELKEGDFIVHADFGVGVYRGLVHLQAGGIGNDYLFIEYLGNDKLYLPVTRLDKVQKFTGAEGAVPQLDRMGGTRWTKIKAKIKEHLREMAGELLRLYAQRKVVHRVPYSPPDPLFREFEAGFPFEETPDQERAIDETLADLTKETPMDRLVCGDVGFGKTEVAMRAAMKVVADQRQVAVLVPTTVLAFQHAATFAERFRNAAVTVDSLFRFRTPKEQKEALLRLKEGRSDIVIGTHRLLSKDVRFKNLGLLIVDEEHRFGVAHKEKIKQLARQVDVLTLTATPIPRTLNMAFSGLRDISIIRTPPTDRLSIRTFVCRFDEEVIRDAVASELARGGQVYFLHNRVESIDSAASLVKRLVPQARVLTGHGQMGEGKLEEVLYKFYRREADVLVCTTIIESGVDLPSVNTLIVHRADTFGLAQLYQIRGRVGRGKERAYAYLLVPSEEALTRDAAKRLAVLMRFTELGSGFRIASHDLEIRGAGNLLGRQQSGHIAAVGLDLYLELLEEAVAELKGERRADQVEPQINTHLPALLPERYIPDASLRLHFYKRLSGCREEEELDRLAEEMEDRLGRLPEEAQTLVHVIELKILLRRLNAVGIDLSPTHLVLQLGDACTLPPQAAMDLITGKGGDFRLTPDMKLIHPLTGSESDDPISAGKKLLHRLNEYGSTIHRG